MPDLAFDTHYEQTLRPRLTALQQRGRRWLSVFRILALGGWALAIWILFTESISPWWVVPLALVVVATGLVVVGEVNGLRRVFRREVLGRLYALEFPEARHDPDGHLDQEALARAGLFPSLFGEQRHELSDRLDCVLGDVALSLCAAGVWVVGPREQNRPDETLFVGTLFVAQAMLPLDEPVIVLCGETPVQPMPAGFALDRQQGVRPGHPVLDEGVRVLCNTPEAARAALPRPVVQALADFVSRHRGPLACRAGRARPGRRRRRPAAGRSPAPEEAGARR